MPPESNTHLHYSLRPLEHGRWSVDRGDGEAGGIFVTLSAAVRFLRSDLETMVPTREPGRAS
jgi:hypothetical protein